MKRFSPCSWKGSEPALLSFRAQPRDLRLLNLLRDRLRLSKQQQIIRAAGLSESVPDILNPPKGCAPTMAPVHLRFKYKLPDMKILAAARAPASPAELEYSAPVRPYSVLSAISSACSKSRARITASTGPKISSCAIRAVGATSAMHRRFNIVAALRSRNRMPAGQQAVLLALAPDCSM